MTRFLVALVVMAASLHADPRPARGGTLVVLNKGEATASLHDDATGKVLAILPTGAGPHEVAVSPDGRTAVACDYGQQEPGRTLTVLDLAKASVVRTIDLGEHRRPHGILWLDDRRVLVTCEVNEAVIVVDVAQGKVERAIETGQRVSHMVAVTPDRSRAFVANIGSGSVTVLDLDSGKKLADVATGAGAEGIDVSPDGTRCWVTNRAADTVSVMDTSTLAIVATLESKSFPIRVKVTPDGAHALVTNAKSGDVSVFDARTLTLARRLEFPAVATDEAGRLFGGAFGASSVPIGILVHPDGARAWIAHAHGDVISVLDLRAWTVISQWRAGKEPDGMAYSPIAVAASTAERRKPAR